MDDFWAFVVSWGPFLVLMAVWLIWLRPMYLRYAQRHVDRRLAQKRAEDENKFKP